MVGLAASITLAQAALVALAALLLAGGRPAARPAAWPLLAPLGAFAAWSLVAALASARPAESLIAAKGLANLAAFWVVLHALPDRAAARRFASGLLVAVGLVAVLGIVQVALCPAVDPAAAGRLLRKCARARGLYSIYMTLAGVLVLALVSALPRLGRARWWELPAWLAGLLALGLTSVRGAWLGFAVGAAGVVVGARRWTLGLGALAVVVAALGLLPGARDRLRTIGDLGDDTTRERLAMLDAGLRMVRDHPLTGIGVGQVKHRYPVYAGPEAGRRSTSHLHDTPLQIVVERGLPGLAAWLAIWIVFFARARAVFRRATAPEDRALVLGASMGVVAFLVAGLFEYNFGDTEVLLVACALMALPFVVEREESGLSSRDTAPWTGGPGGSTP